MPSLHHTRSKSGLRYAKSCGALRNMFMDAERASKWDLKESFILLKDYAGKSLDSLEDAHAVHNFSFASYFLGMDCYEGIMGIPGHSPIPTFLFRGRIAVEGLPVNTKDIMIRSISTVEDAAKSHSAQIAGRRQDSLHSSDVGSA